MLDNRLKKEGLFVDIVDIVYLFSSVPSKQVNNINNFTYYSTLVLSLLNILLNRNRSRLNFFENISSCP